MKQLFSCLLVGMILLTCVGCSGRSGGERVVLWAWERDEDLRFLKGDAVEVAFYAGGIVLRDEEVQMTPRLRNLKVPPDVKLIPVVRMDDFAQQRTSQFLEQHLQETLQFVLNACVIPQAVGCQVDFDVLRPDEQAFYTHLLGVLREKLPTELFLSTTLMVSWCDQMSWVNNLPIQEGVPMFYRMGKDSEAIRYGKTGKGFMKASACQSAVGVSTDEPLPLPQYLVHRRIYVFNPLPWTEQDYFAVIKQIEQRKEQI